MARYEFKLPDIGEGVTEGEITEWHVKPGQDIAEDDPMVEVMTDKATVTIAAPKTGRVLETRGAVGAVVQVHSVLVVLEIGEGGRAAAAPAGAQTNAPPGAPPAHGAGAGHGAPSAPSAASSHGPHARGSLENGAGAVENGAAKGSVASAVGDIREDLPGMQLVNPQRAAAPPPPPAAAAAYFSEKPLATPATRKLARDLGLDLRTVRPTGPRGRVTGDDVRSALSNARSASLTSAAAPVAIEAPATARPAPKPSRQGADNAALEERTPLKGVRKRIFENMARSKQKAAHFTFVEECDVTALKALRARLKPSAAEQGVNLTFLPFIIKAVIAALRKNPSLNSSFDEATQEIVTRRYYNIGVATATDGGLVVPVVKNAGDRSIVDLAREIERLAEDARRGRLALEDIQGSTFTITSLGEKGGLFATPIIHFPEVAILGIHQMKKKPVVRDNQIVIGDVMLLSLSFDHRLIDGHVGAAFAYDIIGRLERPETMFLELI